MGRLTIDDPEIVSTKRVDKQGRVYIGQEYAEQHVNVIIEELADD